MVSACEGNMAETRTMLPVIEAFMAAHQLPDVTIVADAGMVSETNQKEIEAAGLSFILSMRIPRVPYMVSQWRREHPGEDTPMGISSPSPGPLDRPRNAVTRSSTTGTRRTGLTAQCAGSMSRSPRPNRPSPVRPPSDGQPLDREPHWMVHPEVRPHRPPLQHHRDSGRPAHSHRRRPLPDDLRQALEAITGVS